MTAPEGWSTGGRRRRHHVDRAVRVEVNERHSHAMEPADSIERDGTGMPDDHYASEISIQPAEGASSTVGADSVFDDQVAALNGDAEAVARQRQNAVLQCDVLVPEQRNCGHGDTPGS